MVCAGYIIKFDFKYQRFIKTLQLLNSTPYFKYFNLIFNLFHYICQKTIRLATNKHAQIRYIALDKCFRNTGRKYFIEDLMEVCSEAIYNYTGIPTKISRRQIFMDMIAMNDVFGSDTDVPEIIERCKEGRRVYYRYTDPTFSVSNQPMTANEQMQLKESLQTLSRFKGFPQFEWIEDVTTRLSAALNLDNNTKPVIEFEQNDYLIILR